MHHNLGNKKVFILGVAFKKNSDDCRHSSANYIIKELLKEGPYISIYDPKVSAQTFYKELNRAGVHNSA